MKKRTYLSRMHEEAQEGAEAHLVIVQGLKPSVIDVRSVRREEVGSGIQGRVLVPHDDLEGCQRREKGDRVNRVGTFNIPPACWRK